MPYIPSLDVSLFWSRIILAIGLLISASEYWYWRREFDRGGLFDWSILQLSHPFWAHSSSAALFDTLFSASGTRALVAAQFWSGVLLLLPLGDIACAAMLVLSALLLTAMAARMPYGRDGSDQMALLLCVGLSLAYFSQNEAFRLVCAAFITFQLLLSYFVAGVAKLRGPDWRNGRGLLAVMKTTTYGHPWVARFLEPRPVLTRTFAHGLIVAELALAGFVFLPAPYLGIAVICGIGFHLGTAVVMGLTTFFWVFAAAYPLAFAVSRFISGTLG